jgi:hypothetical protein
MLNSLHFSKIWRSAKSWSVVDLRLVLMPLLFVIDSTMRQFGVGLMDVEKPMKRWFWRPIAER